MPVTSPMTVARLTLAAAVEAEFVPDGFSVKNDRLHKSLGRNGHTTIGTSPLQEVPLPNDKNLLQYGIFVQFYGGWQDTINPEEVVDPAGIENYAERFKRVLQANDPDQSNIWYFNLAEITYPEDPTGNMTRFEAKVTAYGVNTSHVETTG